MKPQVSLSGTRKKSKIRPAIAGDYSNMADLWYRASCKAHCFISDDFWYQHKESMENHYFPQAKNYVYQASEDAPISGFASLADSRLAALFVEPESQGQGIGYALMSFVAQCQPRLELAVFEQNLNALRFYYNFGWRLKERSLHAETKAWQLRLEYP